MAWSRREFLRAATGASMAGALWASPRPGVKAPGRRKVVVVTFGGGARDEETFLPEGQENIPHLLSELLPRGTFYAQVVNRGILGHYVATARLATSYYETFNHFAAVPPEHPTVFEFELQQLEDILKLSAADFTAHARNLASPDELSVYIARQLMRLFAPSLLWITLHDIDIAHSGTYSLYVAGIQRSDRLCGEIWKAIQSEPEYAGKTTMFILPDFGRDSDNDAGGNGFQHQRTGDPLSRTTWMLVLGPGVRENVVVDRAVESVDLVPTLGALVGFSPRLAQGRPLEEIG